MASVKKKKTVEQPELIKIMQGKGTGVTRQDMVVVLDLFRETIMEQILSGYPVKTDLFKANVSIRGGFATIDDEFDRSKHTVNVNLHPVNTFKKDLADRAMVETYIPKTQAPNIRKIFDFDSQELREDFTAGSLINLKGAFFTDEDTETQVYLTLDGTTEKIAPEKIHHVKDRNILCTLPQDLAAGSYWITVIKGEETKTSQGTYRNLLTIT